VNDLVKIFIWVAVIGVIFAIMWRKGYLLRMSNYVFETREELKKCSWPSRSELKGSTVIVMVTVGLLGVFTMIVDFIFRSVVQFII
jgi:preprotein translocase subunit SecE